MGQGKARATQAPRGSGPALSLRNDLRVPLESCYEEQQSFPGKAVLGFPRSRLVGMVDELTQRGMGYSSEPPVSAYYMLVLFPPTFP